MPREYERIRNSLTARGVGYDKAQSIAAGKYNTRHPGHPMTGHHSKKRAPKKKTTARILSYGKK